jgi:protein TonB
MPVVRQEPIVRRGLRFALVLAVHAAVLWTGLELAARPELREAAQEMMVRLVELRPAEPEVKLPPPPSRPSPVRPAPPLPVLAAAADAPATAASFVVPPQPQAPAVVEMSAAPTAPPAPPVVTAARFDADYLSNPKPVYPPASRRLGEEGKVVLRVQVSPEGSPLAVEIKHSCGFPRLDESARIAVERWRFVPARQGGEAIESWVAVPIVFSLQTS